MPAATLITAPHAVRRTSAEMRPATTELRAMGSERNRSTRPCWKSVFRPMAVCMAQNVTPCTTSPGRTYWMYALLEPAIAPPKT